MVTAEAVPVAASATETTPKSTPANPPKVSVPESKPVERSDRRDPIVATIGGQEIRESRLRDVLVESHGLNALLNLVQLEIARNEARTVGVKVSEADIDAERELTLDQMFDGASTAEREQLYQQLLERQRMSPAEFRMAMEVNANLRKVAVASLPTIPEEKLRDAFGVIYGEKVQVRHIACQNISEWSIAKARVQSGVPFEKVAMDLSRNSRTGPLGGELPPFTRGTPDLSATFKDAAFALKPGELSEAIQEGNYYHLIKLERKIPPTAVKFEDVQDAVKKELIQSATQTAVKEMRQRMGTVALAKLKVLDPVLEKQWEQKVAASQRQTPPIDRQGLRQEIGPITPVAPAAPAPITPAPSGGAAAAPQ